MNFSVHFDFSRSYTFGRTPWAGDQLVARPLPVHKHRKTNTNLVPILSHIKPVNTIPSYLSNIHFNIVHPPFPTNILYAFLVSLIRATRPAHLILLDLIILIILGEEYKL
ncbi:hypothetical protein B7P43_G06209 [Cryptotermes secundus]|uniref:Uncharacterized protein n=1 Tax=Cryptotermes secundus TaxID=105785 RepID=A0A2J7QN39_9NEOP|nr:hypothetical protein B7P43_G06209 [Cryptotermes secundus]